MLFWLKLMAQHGFAKNIKEGFMKKLLFLTVAIGILALSACSYHSKQPVNPEYYKRTQGVAWPEENTSK